jgi:transmembrane sensor
MNQSNDHIIEQASYWAMLVDECELNEEHKKELTQWLLKSPVHIEEFLNCCAIFDVLTDIDVNKKISIDELLDKINVPNCHTICINSKDAMEAIVPPIRVIKTRSWQLLAASIILSLISLAIISESSLIGFNKSKKQYATSLGEQKSAILEDGSTIFLNTQTNLDIDFSQDFRDIWLNNGEAIFKVAHNPSRPFRVWVEGVVFQALGTEFNVKATNGDVELTVLNGEVALINQSLINNNSLKPDNMVRLVENGTLNISDNKTLVISLGQEAVVLNNGVVTTNIESVIERKTSWKARKLMFKHSLLEDVVYEFNRYNSAQIHISSEAISQLPITGVFEANDPFSLLEFLESSGKAKIKKVGSKKIVIY